MLNKKNRETKLLKEIAKGAEDTVKLAKALQRSLLKAQTKSIDEEFLRTHKLIMKAPKPTGIINFKKD